MFRPTKLHVDHVQSAVHIFLNMLRTSVGENSLSLIAFTYTIELLFKRLSKGPDEYGLIRIISYLGLIISTLHS